MTDRCREGLRLWAKYTLLPAGLKRAGEMVEYQMHMAACAQCTAWNNEQHQRAKDAPVYDWDLEEATK